MASVLKAPLEAASPTGPAPSLAPASASAGPILGLLALSHGINDLTQSLLPAIYPLLKATFSLSYHQIGLITLCNQATASLLQPLVGLITDRRPMPYTLACGMLVSLLGILLLSGAGTFAVVLVAVALVGVGSSVFHPEASRIARLASGGRHGFAQSLFQVGGNSGTAVGPLVAVLIGSLAGLRGCALVPLVGIAVLIRIGRWYHDHLRERSRQPRAVHQSSLSPSRTITALALLAGLIMTKFIYLVSLSSYFTFYLIAHFSLSAHQAQLGLFLYMAAGALGTLAGGPIGDRIGRKAVIWTSILGAAPFALLLPYASLSWTVALAMAVGLIISSAFSAMLGMAQELVPGRVGMVSGLFFGFAFGVGGIAAELLGELIDVHGIVLVFRVVSFLPLLGIIAAFLPRLGQGVKAR